MGLPKLIYVYRTVAGIVLVSLMILLLNWDWGHISAVDKHLRDGNVCVITSHLSCPNETLEMYKDVELSVFTTRLCCNWTHDDFDSVTNIATECRPSTCLPSSYSDICSTLHPRYIDNGKVQLQYEEIYRESCNHAKAGKGVIGVCCVPNSIESQVITRVIAEPNEFPHMAKLRLTQSECGGSVYNSRFIITAAHCVVDQESVENPDRTKVILGSNIGNIEAKQNTYIAKRIILHPEYKNGVLNDIALIELDKEIKFNAKVKALQIAPKGFNPLAYSNKAVRVGWGTVYDRRGKLFLDLLHKSNLWMTSDQSCFRNVKTPFLDQLLCLGGTVAGKWSPHPTLGDSGGPGLCRGSNGEVLLCGVSSRSPTSAAPGDEASFMPSVFVEVVYFHDWIKEVAGEQDKATLYQPYLYGETLGPEQSVLHQVYITSGHGNTGTSACGGTLIAPDVVLTAAHCVVTSHGRLLNNLKVFSVTGQYLGVEHATLWSDFNTSGPVDLSGQGNRITITDKFCKSDIAVVKLLKGISTSKSFPKLAKQGSYFGNSVATEVAFSRDNIYSIKWSELRQREFHFLSTEVCNKRLQIDYRINTTIEINEGVLCAVEVYSGGSTCDRELGGGLFCKGENGKEDVLCGIQTFRLCEFSIPNLFINVAHYSDWIKATMEGF